MTDDDNFWPTPEESALAGWADVPSARARVRDVTIHGDRAEVVIVTDPPYTDWVYCSAPSTAGQEVVSGNGPDRGWRRMRWAR